MAPNSPSSRRILRVVTEVSPCSWRGYCAALGAVILCGGWGVFVGLAVAGWAEEGEVIDVGCATVFPGYDVVYVAVAGAYSA